MPLEPASKATYDGGMEPVSSSKSMSYGTVSLFLIGLLVAGAIYAFQVKKKDKVQSQNFAISYPPPPNGWRAVEHGPQTLFLYEEPKKGLLIRGSVNQMVSDVNPTPDLDRDNVARLIIDNTKSNMPGWTADLEGVVQADGTSFRLVRRAERNLVVVTAFAVEGNTTLLVSIDGHDKNTTQVDKSLTDFQNFISQVKFTKADSSRW